MIGHRIVLAAIAAVVLFAVAPEASGGGGTPISTCGQVVTTNAFLTTNLGPCPGSGIVVGASGITIDLKGFVVKGDRSGHDGVSDTGSFDKVTLKNGVVRNFFDGVFATGDDVTISNLVASGNLNMGIQVLGGASTSVKSSSSSGNGFDGIDICCTGASPSVTATTVAGNGSFGIFIEGASASVRSSVVTGNGGDGIRIFGASASIKSSTVSGNDLDGVSVDGDAAKLVGNRMEANGYPAGASDGNGVGIVVTGFTTGPVGSNVARGNDDPAECAPASLC
jgi:large repetitive protein